MKVAKVMDDRKALMKQLAARSADAWSMVAGSARFPGEVRVESRNTIYRFRDGVCDAVTRRDRPWRTNPTSLIGMRLLGWLIPEASSPDGARLVEEWQDGAYAVLWRAREKGEKHSAVALTSSTLAMVVARESVCPSAPTIKLAAKAVHAALEERTAVTPPPPGMEMEPESRGSVEPPPVSGTRVGPILPEAGAEVVSITAGPRKTLLGMTPHDGVKSTGTA